MSVLGRFTWQTLWWLLRTPTLSFFCVFIDDQMRWDQTGPTEAKGITQTLNLGLGRAQAFGKNPQKESFCQNNLLWWLCFRKEANRPNLKTCIWFSNRFTSPFSDLFFTKIPYLCSPEKVASFPWKYPSLTTDHTECTKTTELNENLRSGAREPL